MNFGEKEKEYVRGEYLEVIQSPKYLDSKKKVEEILESGIYKGLNESHFWILMNTTKTKKVMYSGLIISHDGMLIINDNLPAEKQVDASGFGRITMSDYKPNTMYQEYRDEDVYEVAEVSYENCKNEYPYAMLFKRLFDRVVRRNARLYGVYSEAEADEFKAPDVVVEHKSLVDDFKNLYSAEEIIQILKHYEVEHIEDLKSDIIVQYINGRTKK